MENIPLKDLQNLANIIACENNISLKNQLSAWITSKSGNPEHASLSSLAGLAHHSSVKEQILGWVSNATNPKPAFVYIPDTPMEMIEQPEQIKSTKTEEDAIQIIEPNEMDVCEPSPDGLPMGEGNSEPEISSQESEIENKEEIVKPKRTKKKKSD